MEKVGRNDPCPCGSGKKFKKCHGAGGKDIAPTDAPAATAPEEEPLEGYALTPSQQRRWLDRSLMRSHNRILEMSEQALFEIDRGRLGDMERWALAQRFRELGDPDSYDALRLTLGMSDDRHEAVNYVDILESVIAEVLRSRAQHEASIKAAERLIEVCDEDHRKERSRALRLALQVESEGAENHLGPIDELLKSVGAPFHRDDLGQASLRRGDFADAKKWLDVQIDHPLLAESYKHDLAIIEARSQRASQPGSESPVGVLEKAEVDFVHGRTPDLGACQSALNRALSIGDAVPHSTGRRVLDLARFTRPLPSEEASVLGEPCRRTYRDVSDAAIRWLLESRHRDHFTRSMIDAFGELADTSRTELLELFMGVLICDSSFPDGSTCLSTFGREKSQARSERWEDVLLAMETSHTDLYEIIEVDVDGAATLVNVGNKSTYKVPLTTLPNDAGLRDGLLARLVKLPTGFVCGHGAAIPRSLLGKAGEMLESAIRSAHESSPDLSRARALKKAGIDVLRDLSTLQDEWRNQGLDYPRSQGAVRERIANCQAQLAVTDVARTRRHLNETSWIESGEENTWLHREHALEVSTGVGARTLARIVLEDRTLAVNTLTRQHLGRTTDALIRLLGSGAHVVSTTTAHF